jgi:hypothetical protein
MLEADRNAIVAMFETLKMPTETLANLGTEIYLEQALRRAALEGKQDFIDLILRQGTNVDAQDSNPARQMTALHYALQKKHLKLAIFLVESHNAKVDIPNAHNYNALHLLAIIEDSREKTTLLKIIGEKYPNVYAAFARAHRATDNMSLGESVAKIRRPLNVQEVAEHLKSNNPALAKAGAEQGSFLCSRNFTSEDVKALCQAAWHNPYMETVNFHKSKIDNAAAVHVADLMKNSKTLKHVSLSENAIGEYGAEKLCEALTQCPSVTHFHAPGMPMSLAAAKHLATAIEKPHQLFFVNISHTPFTDAMLQPIVEALEKKPRRFSLEISIAKSTNPALVDRLEAIPEVNVRTSYVSAAELFVTQFTTSMTQLWQALTNPMQNDNAAGTRPNNGPAGPQSGA